MNEQIKIRWYRTKVDKEVLSRLMRTSDFRGFCQVIPQLGLFVATTALAYTAFLNIHADNWTWAVPLLLAALFAHGTFSSFLGLTGPVHELCHKTPFRTKLWNEVFLRIYAFFSWSDHIGFRPSHVKHHQATVHHDYDGEVVLPQKFNWESVRFFLAVFTCNPAMVYHHIKGCARAARGDFGSWLFPEDWMNRVIPESQVVQRLARRRWARTLLIGHLALAILFIVTGNWFLIVLVNFGVFFSPWLMILCGTPQHLGMAPDTPDFRLCCRTYTCGWLPAFLYWNMQYHVEHHMFPAVPFYNLPKLREAIAHDLPEATHGRWATWKELLGIIRKQREDSNYVFVPVLPGECGECISDGALEAEAAGAAA